MKVIHIAGTNGKGSVSIKVASALQKLGYTTGLFTSPHVNTFRERIQVNQQLIAKEDVIQLYKTINSQVQSHNIDIRFFEFLLMMALL